MPGQRSSRSRVAAVTAVSTAVLLLVAGCTGAPGNPRHSTASADNHLHMTCAELVPPTVISALQSGLEPVKSYRPAAHTYPAKIKSLDGLVCSWKAPDGESVVVAATTLSKKQSSVDQSRVRSSSTQTLAFGDTSQIHAYEADTGGTYSGDMEVFTDTDYWISAVSPLFLAPGYAETVIGAVLQEVPSG